MKTTELTCFDVDKPQTAHQYYTDSKCSECNDDDYGKTDAFNHHRISITSRFIYLLII